MRLTQAHYEALQKLAAEHNQKIEITMPDGKTDLIGAQAGYVIMDDYEYYRLARRVGYRPPIVRGKEYQPNGSKEMLRRQRRMK